MSDKLTDRELEEIYLALGLTVDGRKLICHIAAQDQEIIDLKEKMANMKKYLRMGDSHE